MNRTDAISAADLVGEYDDESVPQCPCCGEYHDGECPDDELTNEDVDEDEPPYPGYVRGALEE